MTRLHKWKQPARNGEQHYPALLSPTTSPSLAESPSESPALPSLAPSPSPAQSLFWDVLNVSLSQVHLSPTKSLSLAVSLSLRWAIHHCQLYRVSTLLCSLKLYLGATFGLIWLDMLLLQKSTKPAQNTMLALVKNRRSCSLAPSSWANSAAIHSSLQVTTLTWPNDLWYLDIYNKYKYTIHIWPFQSASYILPHHSQRESLCVPRCCIIEAWTTLVVQAKPKAGKF